MAAYCADQLLAGHLGLLGDMLVGERVVVHVELDQVVAEVGMPRRLLGVVVA